MCVCSIRLLSVPIRNSSRIVVRERLCLFMLALGLVDTNRQASLVVAKTHSLDGSENLHVLGYTIPWWTID
jgi:hypothetical protein